MSDLFFVATKTNRMMNIDFITPDGKEYYEFNISQYPQIWFMMEDSDMVTEVSDGLSGDSMFFRNWTLI